jgi:hypothetical protein
MTHDAIQIFDNQRIRTAWDETREEWLFSVVDVVGALTGQATSRGASTYWAVLKNRLKEEGAGQLLTNCKQLKMLAADGKSRLTDVADTEQLLRIIQSVPSPRAEPFKRWLAQVGRERIDETFDPELIIDRALRNKVAKSRAMPEKKSKPKPANPSSPQKRPRIFHACWVKSSRRIDQCLCGNAKRLERPAAICVVPLAHAPACQRDQ